MATDVEGSVHEERIKGNTFPMHQHFLYSSAILFMLLSLSWMMPIVPSLCFRQEADLCFGCVLAALVCDTLPQFQIRASHPPVLVRKCGTLGQ